MLRRIFARPLAFVWGTLAAVAFIFAFLSLAPVGAWAERVLGLLRIKKIAVVSIDTDRFRSGDDRFGKRIGQLLSDNVVVTKEPGESQLAAGAGEASELAGFSVRLLGGRTDEPELRVNDSQGFRMTVDLSRLQAIFDEAGRADLRLPASLDGATVAVDIPKSVVAFYGSRPAGGHRGERDDPDEWHGDPGEWLDRVVLAQVPAPTIVTPPDLNLAEIAVVALQLVGMSEEEARAFSRTVDWTSTLVVPIPMNVASYEAIEVDGVKGTLVRERRDGHRSAGYTLLWVKKGIIYSLTGFGDSAQALTLADSLE
jgi:hypothetical protein